MPTKILIASQTFFSGTNLPGLSETNEHWVRSTLAKSKD